MRTDGNLVLTSAAGVRQWATFTTGAGNTATMQTDGNFVVRNSRGVTLWSTADERRAGRSCACSAPPTSPSTAPPP